MTQTTIAIQSTIAKISFGQDSPSCAIESRIAIAKISLGQGLRKENPPTVQYRYLSARPLHDERSKEKQVRTYQDRGYFSAQKRDTIINVDVLVLGFGLPPWR